VKQENNINDNQESKLDNPGEQSSTLATMQAQPRWLLWRSEPNKNSSGKGRKVPYYANGKRRGGKLDVDTDLQQLVTYAEAHKVLTQGEYTGLAFALGPDGSGCRWQGVDLDNVVKNNLTHLVENAPGYVEVSPSGDGYHVIGYGKPFKAMGSNSTGVEAYSDKRFFTFTGNEFQDSGFTCIASYVEQQISPAHTPKQAGAAQGDVGVHVDARVVADLRSALLYMRADAHPDWVSMGLALCGLGDTGRGLWMVWSATSSKFDPSEASKKWETFKSRELDYQSVFYAAQKRGWVNPASNEAQGGKPCSKQDGGQLRIEKLNDRAPRDIIKKITPESFEPSDAPDSIARFAKSVSEATGFDFGGLLVAAVTSAAAIIDDRYKLQVRPGWNISARQWAVIIGPSAAGKSPTIRNASDTIKDIHAEEVSNWHLLYDDVPEAERRSVPPMPSRYTSDTTVPALSEKLKGNPQGLLMLTEEFSSWIGALESSNKGDAAQNRGAWLQLRDGGRQQIDRISRGSIIIENWGVSVLAACTAGGLTKQMKEMPEDGLIQRFACCIMGNPDLDAVARGLNPEAAIKDWDNSLRWACDATTRPAPQICLRFTKEAQLLFNAEDKKVKELSLATDDFSTAYASHLGKHAGMLAEICIVFHVFSASEVGVGSEIEASAVEIAIRYMKRIRKHSAYLYSTILSSSPSFELARGVARSIVATKEGLTTVDRDWMTRHCLAFRKADDRVRRAAVQFLADADWLEAAADVKQYGGWPKKYQVNQQVFRLFAKDGEEWRKRRAAVKDMIGEG